MAIPGIETMYHVMYLYKLQTANMYIEKGNITKKKKKRQ